MKRNMRITKLLLLGLFLSFCVNADTVTDRYVAELDSNIEWTKHEAARNLGILKNQGKLSEVDSEVIVQKLIRNLYQSESDTKNNNVKGCSRIGNLTWTLGQFKDATAIPSLTWCLRNNSKPEIRKSAAWALQCFDRKAALPLLIQALRIEQDDKVLNQIGASIESLSHKEYGFDPSRPNGPFEDLDAKRELCLQWWMSEGETECFSK